MSRQPTRESERIRIQKSFVVYSLDDQQRRWILEALDSDQWDWFKDCDGCTGVSELHWPTKYFPPCLRHDFDWATGNGGMEGSKIFYNLQRAYGVPRWRSALRTSAVTVVWYTWSRFFRRR